MQWNYWEAKINDQFDTHMFRCHTLWGQSILEIELDFLDAERVVASSVLPDSEDEVIFVFNPADGSLKNSTELAVDRDLEVSFLPYGQALSMPHRIDIKNGSASGLTWEALAVSPFKSRILVRPWKEEESTTLAIWDTDYERGAILMRGVPTPLHIADWSGDGQVLAVVTGDRTLLVFLSIFRTSY